MPFVYNIPPRDSYSYEWLLSTTRVADHDRPFYIPQNTLTQNLSQSDDFSQVFLPGRARGHWFLTGKTGGVEKAAAKKARKLAEAARMSSTNINDADDPPINQLPYPIKMEGNSPAPTLPSLTPLTPPLPSRARTTRSPPPRSVRGVNLSEAVAR